MDLTKSLLKTVSTLLLSSTLYMCVFRFWLIDYKEKYQYISAFDRLTLIQTVTLPVLPLSGLLLSLIHWIEFSNFWGLARMRHLVCWLATVNLLLLGQLVQLVFIVQLLQLFVIVVLKLSSMHFLIDKPFVCFFFF